MISSVGIMIVLEASGKVAATLALLALTTDPLCSYGCVRGYGVRRGLWSFVLLLLSGIVCVSMIPQTDLPETSYNEVDTPINQAPPVVAGSRFVRPDIKTAITPRRVFELRLGVRAQALPEKMALQSAQRDPHPLQDVLCSFLI
jgi:hypothetical protein